MALKLMRLEERIVLDATFTVDNSNDAGAGSLRQAVLDANANPGHDNINFSQNVSGQTIALAGSDIDITDAVSIDGSNANVTVSGNGNSGVFNIDANNQRTDLTGLTITDGSGAAVLVSNGGLYMNNCWLTNSNDPNNLQAGLTIEANGSATVENSVITGNNGGYGGVLNKGNITIMNSTISGNHGSKGGGITNFAGGTAGIYESLIVGNTLNGALAGGAGIYNIGDLTVVNGTISGNSTLGNTPGAHIYGGIFNDGTALIANSTIADNDSDSDNNGVGEKAGGIGHGFPGFPGSASIDVISSILARNNGSSGQVDISDAGDFFQSFFRSLVENPDNANISLDLNNVKNQSSGLDIILRDNGGPTKTYALFPGSAAIDAGENPKGSATDARGFNRTTGGGVDMGAFESNFSASASSSPVLQAHSLIFSASSPSSVALSEALFNTGAETFSDLNPSGNSDTQGQHDNGWSPSSSDIDSYFDKMEKGERLTNRLADNFEDRIAVEDGLGDQDLNTEERHELQDEKRELEDEAKKIVEELRAMGFGEKTPQQEALEQIEAHRELFAEAIASGVTAEEYTRLNNELNRIVNEITEARDEIIRIMNESD